jgi:hypothetical protein
VNGPSNLSMSFYVFRPLFSLSLLSFFSLFNISYTAIDTLEMKHKRWVVVVVDFCFIHSYLFFFFFLAPSLSLYPFFFTIVLSSINMKECILGIVEDYRRCHCYFLMMVIAVCIPSVYLNV